MKTLVLLYTAISLWLNSLLQCICGLEIIDEQNVNPLRNPSLYAVDTLSSPSSLFPLGGSLPLERVHHSIDASSNYVFVYGGYDKNGTTLGDMNLYHIPSQTWSNPIIRYECCNEDGFVIETIGADQDLNIPFTRNGFSGDFPLPRAEHDSCVISEELYVFGGVTKEYGLMNDLYKFNPQTLEWIQLNMASGSEIPSRRAGHVLVSDQSTVSCYLFGGRTGNTGSEIGLYDVWSLNTLTLHWTRIDLPTINSQQRPFARQYSAAMLMNGDLYIFGGMDPQSGLIYRDLWRFDVTSHYWKEIKPSEPSTYDYSPPPLAHSSLFPSLCDDTLSYSNCQGVLIYGGVGSGGFCGSQTLCGAQQTVLGQLYQYSFSLREWIDPFFPIDDAAIPLSTKSHWLYARLTSGIFSAASLLADNVQFNDHNRNNGGKYIKTYGMEKVIFVPQRRKFYEFGGVQAIAADVMNNGQQNELFSSYDASKRGRPRRESVVQTIMPTFQDVGGPLVTTFSDVQTGEQLRSQLDLPTNQFWDYTDSRGATPTVQYLRSLRLFAVADHDVILMQEDRI